MPMVPLFTETSSAGSYAGMKAISTVPHKAEEWKLNLQWMKQTVKARRTSYAMKGSNKIDGGRNARNEMSDVHKKHGGVNAAQEKQPR
jgi:hypothetical protein